MTIRAATAAVLAIVATTAMAAPPSESLPPSQEIAERTALADRYFEVDGQLEHRQRIISLALKRNAGEIFACGSQQCRNELDKSIDEIASEAARKYVIGATAIYARRFSAFELKALVDFYGSPTGQSIVHTRDGITDEMDTLVASSVHDQFQSLARRFCPTHMEACSGWQPTAPPTLSPTA